MKFAPFFQVSLKGLDEDQNPSTKSQTKIKFQDPNFNTHLEKEAYFLSGLLKLFVKIIGSNGLGINLEFGLWDMPRVRPRFSVIKSGNPRGIKEKSAKYSSRGTRKLASGGKRYYNR